MRVSYTVCFPGLRYSARFRRSPPHSDAEMLRHSEQHGADEAVRASWRVRRDVFQLPQADRPHSSGAPSGAGAQTPPPSAAGYPEPDGFQPAQDDADSRDSRISPEPVRGAAERKADLDRRIAVPERHYPVLTPVFPHQQPGQPDAIPGRGTPRRVGRRAGNFAGHFRSGFRAVRCPASAAWSGATV